MALLPLPRDAAGLGPTRLLQLLPLLQLGGKFEGKPLSACPTCNGKGRTLCSACGASGLRNAWLWKPADDPGWGPRGEP